MKTSEITTSNCLLSIRELKMTKMHRPEVNRASIHIIKNNQEMLARGSVLIKHMMSSWRKLKTFGILKKMKTTLKFNLSRSNPALESLISPEINHLGTIRKK